MDTHLHLLVRTASANLGQGMQRLLGGYAHWFNRRHRCEGQLFTSPYFSRRVERDEHLVAAATYIALNPVAAGLCRHPSAWQWSSYAATAGFRSDFVASRLLLEMLGADIDRARRRYVALVDEAADAARKARHELSGPARQGSG